MVSPKSTNVSWNESSGFLIREARLDDASGISKVHVDSWRTTYRGMIADDFLTSLSYEQREPMWRQALSHPDYGKAIFIYVAEDAYGQITGFASAGPEREGDPVYASELYTRVLPS